MSRLDEESQEEYREAFAEFDKKKLGRLDAKNLQALMRHMGVIMADHEILEMMRECGGTQTIELNAWMEWMSKKNADNYTTDDLVLAFRAFDKVVRVCVCNSKTEQDGNGYISMSELRYVLTCLGDRLDDQQVDTMLDQADPSGCGAVQYEGFVKQMMSRGTADY